MIDDARLARAIALAAPAIRPGLPIEMICREHLKFEDNEIENGRILSPRSSTAVVANTFGAFLENPSTLPNFLADLNFAPLTSIGLEHCAYFPWPKSHGEHPRLDVMIESAHYLIGIEAKRYEPFDRQKPTTFSKAHWRPVWGDRMQPFERMCDRLHVADWVPHISTPHSWLSTASVLRTEAARRKKRPILIYLLAEPNKWPDGPLINDEARQNHTAEAMAFSEQVRGSEVQMSVYTYRQLFEAMRQSPVADVRKCAAAVAGRFDI